MVIGCGAHASSVISIIESSNDNYEIIGLIDTADHYDENEIINDYKVILSLKDLLNFPEKYTNVSFFLAIGDNAARKGIFDILLNKNFILPNIVSSSAFVDRTVRMGVGNIISHSAVINAGVVLVDNNLINTASIIEHHCTINNHNHIAPRALLCGGVNISNMVFVGAGSILLPNVSVADSSTIGAGSLLLTDVKQKGLTYLGTPAKVKIK